MSNLLLSCNKPYIYIPNRSPWRTIKTVGIKVTMIVIWIGVLGLFLKEIEKKK